MNAPLSSLKAIGEDDNASPDSEKLLALYDEDVRWLAGTVQGRRVLGRLLFADCSLTDLASNPTEAGHREVGVEWASRLQRLCPDQLPTIWAERLVLLRQHEKKQHSEF